MFRRAAVALTIVTTFIAGAVAGRTAAREDPRVMLGRIVAAYDSSTATHDPEVVVRYFRPDVFVISPQSREPAIGIDANRAAWKRFFAMPKSEHTMKTAEIVMAASGDLAYSRATWTATMQLPDSTMAPGGGDVVTVWRRDPSSGQGEAAAWRVAVVMAHRSH